MMMPMTLWIPLPVNLTCFILGPIFGCLLTWLWISFVRYCDLKPTPSLIPWTRPDCKQCFEDAWRAGRSDTLERLRVIGLLPNGFDENDADDDAALYSKRYTLKEKA
jgi:hypothetical protein